MIDFDVTFNSKNQVYDFVIDLVNDGSVDAMIDKITETGNELGDLSFTYTYANYFKINDDETKETVPVKVGDPLYANSKKSVRVVIKPAITENEYEIIEEKNYHLTLGIEFAQLDTTKTINTYEENTDFNFEIYQDETLCPRNGAENIDPTTHHTLYIDPNGGTYDGSTNPDQVELWKNQTYALKSVSKETTFNGAVPIYYIATWEITPVGTNFNTDTNTIKMEDTDIYAKAIWIETDAVARIEETYYQTIQAAFNAATAGDMIYLLRDTTESPINRNLEDITLNLDGYKVTGTLTNNGRLTLVNNNADETSESWFKNENGYGMINNGIFSLANKDDNIEKNKIALIGSADLGGVGLKNNATFNFYDGYLEGYIGLDGIYNDVPDKDDGEEKDIYAIVDHNNERDCQKVYVGPQPALVVAKTEEQLPGTEQKII